MYKQDYLEVFINDANRVTISTGNVDAPDVVSIDRHDLRKLSNVLNDLASELEEELDED